MTINDRVYGDQEVNDQVLLDLLGSKPLVRIQKINQAGASSYALKWQNITRYEHCVGVMLLLKMFGASLEEQIAGLLHDVPHTAFSHTIDHVFESEDHTYHEKFLEKIVLNSEIPSILKKHGFDIGKILDIKSYSLLEKEIPDLCADRIDYFLRHLKADPRFKDVDTGVYLEHLKVWENEFALDDKKVAYDYTQNYLKANKLSWASAYEIGAFMLMAQSIKIALERGIIEEKDLFLNDRELYEKLTSSANSEIMKRLKLLNHSLKVTEDSSNYQLEVRGKLRFIDPKVIEDRQVKRVSEIYPEFKQFLENYKKTITAGYKIRIEGLQV